MSTTGLAIVYIIIWWIVFFAILPIDVERKKLIKVEGEDPGSPENPKMLKKFIYCTGITTILFVLIYLLMTFDFEDFKFKDGILIKVNKKWIFSYIILLSIWFLLLPSEYVTLYSKLGLVVLILYPLLFPLEEYFIHRASSLSICSAIHWYLSSKVF